MTTKTYLSLHEQEIVTSQSLHEQGIAFRQARAEEPTRTTERGVGIRTDREDGNKTADQEGGTSVVLMIKGGLDEIATSLAVPSKTTSVVLVDHSVVPMIHSTKLQLNPN